MSSAVTPAGESAQTGGLAALGVSKQFGSVVANEQVDLVVRRGKVHALLGENGAGKSTLVSMLDGRVEPDGGSIELDGAPVDRMRDRGTIATVHQTLALVPSMTGLENIALDLGRAGDRRLREEIRTVEERFSLHGRLDVAVADLELPQRQRIALLAALSQEPTILILDEPTTFLPPTDVGPFLQRVRELAEAGVGVLLITHHLEEARSVADSVTVLRAGRVVARYEARGLPDNAALARAVVGESIVEPARRNAAAGDPVLSCTGLGLAASSVQVVSHVDLDVHRGEILGIAGVDGNGQLELLETLAGLRRPSGGSIMFEGNDISRMSLRSRARLGLQFVSGERLRDGIIPTFTVAQHFQIDRVRPGAGQSLETVLERYDVRPPRPAMRADRLSGGNQQKMIMGRALERSPRLLILAYPTQGLDVLATSQIHRFLLEQADAGVGVLISSSDLDELLSICDRIAVMSRGGVAGIQSGPEFDRAELATWFTSGDRSEVAR